MKRRCRSLIRKAMLFLIIFMTVCETTSIRASEKPIACRTEEEMAAVLGREFSCLSEDFTLTISRNEDPVALDEDKLHMLLDAVPYRYSTYRISLTAVGVPDDGMDLYSFHVRYTMTKDELQQTKKKAEKILDEMHADSMRTKTEKLVSIYAYLTEHVTYRSGDEESYYNYATPYAALIKGSANCRGIAAAFQMLCDRAGITCDTVYSDLHVFSMIRFGGRWYSCDVTEDLGKQFHDWTGFMRGKVRNATDKTSEGIRFLSEKKISDRDWNTAYVLKKAREQNSER